MSIHSKILLTVPFAALGTSCRKSPTEAKINSVYLQPAITVFSDETKFLPADLTKLLASLETGPDSAKVSVMSSATDAVAEPAQIDGVVPVNDLDSLGYGKSKFLANSRWATVRYVGPALGAAAVPAGAGLTGTAQDEAQAAAIGKANDSVPVVTAAWAITRIMDEYFAPILRMLPNGENILSQFKVQGAYFAPGYVSADGHRERDNAFMVGLQSLYLWPSSCFESSQRSDCKAPFMSTGHDPTVVGHEVAHAVFNHLRGAQSLDGFQWTAVNEGYADYFSASYYSEPRIGRIWKVAGTSVQHLRAINGTPTTSSAALIAEAHQFSTIWSSALWRIRNRLVSEQKAEVKDVDTMVAFSITFLGETATIRLGDAGIALLKAAEATNHTAWKNIIREELAVAEIALSNAIQGSSDSLAQLISASSGAEKSPGTCGTIAASSSLFARLFAFVPVLFAAFFASISLRRKSQ